MPKYKYHAGYLRVPCVYCGVKFPVNRPGLHARVRCWDFDEQEEMKRRLRLVRVSQQVLYATANV